MVRTWVVTIGLAVLWGSVCTGQQGYETMAPVGIGDSGFTLASLSLDQTSMNQTLAGVQGNLDIFEQTSLGTGLPPMMMPTWASQFGQLQSGMSLQPTQVMTTIDLGSLLSNPSGPSSSTTLPLNGLTVGSINMGQMGL